MTVAERNDSISQEVSAACSSVGDRYLPRGAIDIRAAHLLDVSTTFPHKVCMFLDGTLDGKYAHQWLLDCWKLGHLFSQNVERYSSSGAWRDLWEDGASNDFDDFNYVRSDKDDLIWHPMISSSHLLVGIEYPNYSYPVPAAAKENVESAHQRPLQVKFQKFQFLRSTFRVFC